MKQRVYISGRMSGLLEEQIKESFGFAELSLKESGYKVFNPARWRWFLRFLPYKVALAFDIFMMCFCDSIYMLKGWSLSDGATVEHRFACATGMIILFEQ